MLIGNLLEYDHFRFIAEKTLFCKHLNTPFGMMLEKKFQNWTQIENCPLHTKSKNTKVLHLGIGGFFEGIQSWPKKEKMKKIYILTFIFSKLFSGRIQLLYDKNSRIRIYCKVMALLKSFFISPQEHLWTLNPVDLEFFI